LFEPKATRKELRESNETIGKSAIALSALVGQMFAAAAKQTGMDLRRLEADFREISGQEQQDQLHSLFAEVLAKELQLEAKRAELQSLRDAYEAPE